VSSPKSDEHRTLYNVLLRESTLEEAITKTQYDLDLVPPIRTSSQTNLDLVDQEEREKRLQTALTPIRDRYDYILIDCPPALDLLTLNALVASDSVLVPIQCEFFALEGISQLLETIDGIKPHLIPVFGRRSTDDHV